MPRFLLTAPGPRPPFYQVAEHLWGKGCGFDSDGDSDHPDATDWTELTVSLRLSTGESSADQRVDVDPIDSAGPLVLVIESDNGDLARKAAAFLKEQAGGTLAPG